MKVNVDKVAVPTYCISIELDLYELQEFASDLGNEIVTGKMWDELYASVRMAL